jgi:hypothetical protein
MLVSQIKSIFFSKFDQFASAYLSDVKLNNFFNEAQTEVVKDLCAQFQLSSRITEDCLPILRTENIIPTTNEINLDTDLAFSYNTLISAEPKYVTSKGDIQYAAKPLFNNEKNSVFASGTTRYPRFDQYSNASSDRILLIYPTNTLPDEVKLTYFINPQDINFASPSTNLPFTNNYINLIIDKAIQLANSATRDEQGFQDASVLLTQSNSVQ